jgi:DNA-binding MarR family transcriptional regulator
MKSQMDAFLESLLSMTRLMHRRLKAKCGSTCTLSPIQIQAMVIVKKEKRLTMKAFSDELGMNPSATTALVDGLVNKDYIKRRTDKNDRRSCYLELSSSGLKMIDSKMKRLADELRSTVGVLSEEERKTLGILIKKIIDAHLA